MAKKRQIVAALLTAVLALTLSGWYTTRGSAPSPDYYHLVQRNIELFGRVYQEISKRYVAEVDPTKFMRAGIQGMLATLDPYTVLVEKEDSEELQIMSSGKYGGLGMRIGVRGNLPTVVEPPFDGTPALKAGIREGDQILTINGEETRGISVNQVATMLRGEIGTEVYLQIIREGDPDPIEFRLIRAEIIVTDVLYTGFIRDDIGYIRLSHFSKNAGKDIERAIRDLKKERLGSLVLDLRSNPGGLLDAAVAVAENFIEKGETIVSTQDRSGEIVQVYKSEEKPVLGDLPIAILVNGLSASASEIVAGAVQDLDRGIIIGQKTFGKGLVQTVIPLTGDAALKITTAKYIVPSGRSIQDPVRFLKDPDNILYFPEEKQEESANRPAEVKERDSYQTRRGRMVPAGQGITPDVDVDPGLLSRYEIELLRKTMPFQFAVIYAAQHPELQRGFEITDDVITQFHTFLEEKEFDFTSDAQSALKEIESIANKEEYLADASPSIAQLREIINRQKKSAFEQSREFIREELQQEISAKLWGTKAEMEASFDSDEAIRRAADILSDPALYDSYLAGSDGNKE